MASKPICKVVSINWRTNIQPSTGDGKTLDAANFGVFKVNWGMLRVCAKRAGFVGQPESQWNNGAKLK
jgi:hypothetical protein